MDRPNTAPPEMASPEQLEVMKEGFVGTPKHREIDGNMHVGVVGNPVTNSIKEKAMQELEQASIVQHNAACLRAAETCMDARYRKNVLEMQKLVHEPSILRMAADTVTGSKVIDQLDRYDFGAFPLYLAKLRHLTFLEKVDLLRRVNAELERWNNLKTALECIEDMKIADTSNKEIMRINTMARFGFSGTNEEFTKEFLEKEDQLKKIAAVLNVYIDESKEGLGTTSFTTTEMVALMRKRIADQDSNDPGYAESVKHANTLIDIFEHRTDFEFLRNRIEIYLKTNKKNLKRAFGEISGSKMPKCMKTLVRNFGYSTMYRVWYTLIFQFGQNADATFVMMNFLAKLLDTEKKTGASGWAKVFILNMSDIQRDVFDLEDPTTYLCKIPEHLLKPILDFLKNNKINSKINPGYSYQYKLETPEEYVNALSDYEANHELKILQVYADERQAAIDKATADLNAMKAADGLTPEDEPIGDSNDGVPTSDELSKVVQEDVAKRAAAAGISMEEITAHMTPEQREQMTQPTNPDASGRGKTQPYVYERPHVQPYESEDSPVPLEDSDSEVPNDPPMSERLNGMKIPD